MKSRQIAFLQKMVISLFFLCVLSALSNSFANEVEAIHVGTVVATAGEKSSGFIEVPALSDKSSRIPVSVINGANEGPTLALIGGTHGYEYAPIVALQHLAKSLNPKDLSGAIIIVHVANMPAFLGRNIYYSPIDGKNLNRVYPGNAEGSLSERIADSITRNVIDQSDYLIDMHSGDGNEDLRPYIYMPRTGNEALDATIKAMAVSFGIDHIIIDRTTITTPENSVFVDMTGLSRAIPSMTTEVGGVGSTDAKWVNMNLNGVMNLLRHLKMLAGDPHPPQSIVWLENYQVITSPQTGIFIPSVRSGYMVAEGGIVGELVDFFGNPVSQIKAPFSGVINYVIVTPPVSQGEPLVMISRIAKELQ